MQPFGVFMQPFGVFKCFFGLYILYFSGLPILTLPPLNFYIPSMRKLLLTALMITSSYFINAQVKESEARTARQLVKLNSNISGLTAADLENSIVASTYKVTGGDDVQMVYLQQSYKGIPVFNELQVMAFKQGKLMSRTGSRISTIEEKTNNNNGVPTLTVLNAVQKALQNEGLTAKEQIVPVTTSPDGYKFTFGKLGVSLENISADLIWFPVGKDKQQVRLVWQVFVAPVNSTAYWLIRVDALNGNILGKQNLTITCNWVPEKHSTVEHATKHINTPAENTFILKRNDQVKWNYRPFIVSSAKYRVIPFPSESPTHLGANSALVTNPWTLAPGNATSLGWHNDGSGDHDSTRGNNVWAAEDKAGTNTVIDRAAVSSTALPNLNFDFTPDYTQPPRTTSPPNQQFGITNLFYWNNIMHDLSYLYGFDEAAGNFQNNNQGRGGLGNDYVVADAQDGAGTGNANFATPVDGSRPRMQMYLWNTSFVSRDGDLDNGIVAHEYTHGISNRLTGGPAIASCLGNAEHGGEGWSDYFALMVTTDWATANAGDGVKPRSIGTYVLDQPITGNGIRNFKYSTNIATNPLVYRNILPSESHDRGEFWCMALWEMTWEIIQVAGINPNLFNPAAPGGNSVALKLVTEGMRLQPCSPGFIDARNAILKADTLFYGGQYSCAIWKAFAKRGMGRGASQGSSESVTDQVVSFNSDNSTFSITQSVTQVPEGQNVTYTRHVTAGNCAPLANAYITDTLPTTVTWISGGVYNATNRTVTHGPINLNSLQSQDYSFTVSVNPGTFFIPVEHLNESVPNAAIPATWTAASSTSTVWTTSTINHSAPNAFYGPNPPSLTDHRLATTSAYNLNSAPSSFTLLSFWHRFDTEEGWDGGVVEVSTDGGTNWSDVGTKMSEYRYNGSLGTGSGNLLGGRQAFTGLINSFTRTSVNLSSYSGQPIKFRFRFATDDNTAPAGGGWFVDDINLKTIPAVYIKSNLFSFSNSLLAVADTFTQIMPDPSCIPASITGQPSAVTTCVGNNAVLTVAGEGSGTVSYQWQVNTGSGFIPVSNVAPYSGATTASLTISNVTTAMNGYQYRAVVANGCASLNSSIVSLTVTAGATVTTQPTTSTVCIGATTTFTTVATGATGYQWQVNTGSGFVDITNSSTYSGATTSTLTVTGVTAGMNNYVYRAVISSCGSPTTTNAASLVFWQPAVITGNPAHSTICAGSGTSFTVSTTGSIVGYQWQISTDGGTVFSNINGQTSATLTLNALTTTQNGNVYRVIVSGNCGSVTSIGAILQVKPTPTFTLGPIPSSLCVSDSAITLTAIGFIGTWSGSGVQINKFNPFAAGAGSATVTFTGTNDAGCSASKSTVIQVNDCSDRHLTLSNPGSLIILPNPSNGNFQVWVKTDLYTRLFLRVFASDGKLMASQSLSGITYDKKVPIDLTRLASGVYHLSFSNDEGGNFTSHGFKVVIAR